MKPKPSVRDEDLDALLARRYRDTTPEFEARWVALKRELRQAPAPPRHRAWSGWTGWLVAGAAAAVILVASLTQRQPGGSGPEISPALAELFAMDAVLSHGSALLDPESRDALMHLPARPSAPNL
jgi:hypothetical protein